MMLATGIANAEIINLTCSGKTVFTAKNIVPIEETSTEILPPVTFTATIDTSNKTITTVGLGRGYYSNLFVTNVVYMATNIGEKQNNDTYDSTVQFNRIDGSYHIVLNSTHASPRMFSMYTHDSRGTCKIGIAVPKF